MRFISRLTLVVSLAALCGLASAQTPAVAPLSTNAAPVPSAFSLAEVVPSADATATQLQAIDASLSSDAVNTINQKLPGWARDIGLRRDQDRTLLDSKPSLPNLKSARANWQAVAGEISAAKQLIGRQLATLEGSLADLNGLGAKWKATQAALQQPPAVVHGAGAVPVPPELSARAQVTLDWIAKTRKVAENLRGQMLSSQALVALQDDLVTKAIAALTAAQASAVNQLFVQDSPPLWEIVFRPAGSATPVDPKNSFAAQVQALRIYVAEKLPTVFIHLLIFGVLAIFLFWGKQKIRAKSQDDPAWRHAVKIFDVPLATAAVLALLASLWLYPVPPPLFSAGIGAAALLPAVIILRRLIEPPLFLILYAMVFSYFVDQVRGVLVEAESLSRLLLFWELLAGSLFLIWFLRSNRLATAADKLERNVRFYVLFTLGVFAFSLIANLLGYAQLAIQVGNSMLESSYLAVIVYATVLILEGLMMTLFRIRPFTYLTMVRNHYALLCGKMSALVRGVAVLLWLLAALEIFSLATPLWAWAQSVLSYKLNTPPTPPPGGAVVAARTVLDILLGGLAIWLTFYVSRIVRFVLEEEVYPRFQLQRDVAYTMSTLVHYAILVFGCLIALNVMSIDLTQYTLLAGAMGVGLGFGLQNIMNNFVSGIILLFERPIKVGDVIQLDPATVGTVQSIGIRASVVRIVNGSEIIVPNGNLISNQVTNWTFSNRLRLIEISVPVPAKSDPAHIMSLLDGIAQAHPLVLKDPAPRTLLMTFSAVELSFQVRAWTDRVEDWMQIRSELSVTINAAMSKETAPV